LEQLRLGEEVGDAGNEGSDQRVVDSGEMICRENAAAVARDPLDAIGRGRREQERDRRDNAPREPPQPCPVLVPKLGHAEPRQRRAHGIGGESGGRSFSSNCNRCSSWAILSSASSSSSRVTSPTSRKSVVSLAATRSPTVASPRHSAMKSSARSLASSRRSRGTAAPLGLAGSAMRTRAPPLPAALSLLFGRGDDVLDRVDRRQVRGRFGRGGLLGLLEDRLGGTAVALDLDVLAACELRLALLQDRQQRRRDEDRRVGARGDADEQREREVLQGRAAEDEQSKNR